MGQDLRLAARQLAGSPGFTLIAIVVLALGIGGLTPTFSVVDAYLLRPLPFAEPERLVHLWGTEPRRGLDSLRVSLPDLRDWQRRAGSFEGLAAFNYTSEDLTGGDRPETVSAGRVSAGAFEVLGVAPAIGRGFRDGEDRQGAEPVVVLSHRLWQQRHGGRADVLGTTVEINRRPYTVVGVMPPEFVFPLPTTALWLPWELNEAVQPREGSFLQVIGRLRPGVSRDEARIEMDAVAANLARAYPETNRDRGVRLEPLRAALNFGHEIFQMLAAVLLPANLLVLLIACGNVSCLLIARGIGRRREIAIRASLGASRGRLVRLLLAESLLLAAGGGALGVLLATWISDLLARVIPDDLYRVGTVGIDARALLFTGGVAVLSALTFGLLPALRTSGVRLSESLKEAGTTVTASRRDLRLQRVLVAGQVAMAVVLLVCTSLIVRSFRSLSDIDPGFAPGGVLTLTLNLPEESYPTAVDVTGLQRRLLEEVTAVPGVVTAAAANFLPLNHETQPRELTDLPPAAAGEPLIASQVSVSPGYFELLRVPLLEGRGFVAGDDAAAPAVVIVNRTLADRLWPDGNAVGREFGLAGSDRTVRVVGVAGDTRHQDLAAGGRPQIYLPLAQAARRYFRLLVRTAGDPAAAADVVLDTVWRVDRALPPTEVRPLERVIDEFLLPRRSMAATLASLALTAIVLGCAGIYGLMTFFVSSRRHEIGVRLALGARPGQVMGRILGGGLRLTLAGLAAGLAGAAAVSHLLRGVLFGVEALDPATFLAVPATVAALALAACYLPARRAAEVDPMTALRGE